MGGRGRQISEFEASLVYRVSSRTARATQRNPVSKTTTTKAKQKKRTVWNCRGQHRVFFLCLRTYWYWPWVVLRKMGLRIRKEHQLHLSVRCTSSACVWPWVSPKPLKDFNESQAVVAHACNPSTWEAEAGRFLSWRPAWSTEWVPGHPGLYRETLSRKTKKKKEKKKKT